MELIRTATDDYGHLFRWAQHEQLIRDDDHAIIFYDFDVLNNRLAYLQRAFPEQTLHAVAIKSNPLFRVLQHIGRQGFGLEAASLEEVMLAHRAGLPAGQLVFDSPVKTRQEIAWCHTHTPGMHFNVNALQELERIPADTQMRVGLRINPLVDPGSPDVYNVSTAASKFGIPITQWEAIIEAAVAHPFIEGLHLHIGSEMSRLDVHAQAVAKILDLAKSIEQARAGAGVKAPLTFIDIGGGFPAHYGKGAQPDLTEYLHFLRKHAPALFTDYRIITEFGRFVQAHTAWLLSDVEYVLQGSEQQPDVPIIHCGADLLLREIYQPGAPEHQLSVLDAQGHPKTDASWPVHLAGPLCFAGDYLARGTELPRLQEGDKVVVADIGANSFSMWSRHCSRVFPKVIGYSQKAGSIQILKEREKVDDVVRFWGG